MSELHPPTEATDPDDDRRMRAYWNWILLRGDRTVVAAGIAGLFLAFFSGLALSGVVPLANAQPLFYVYSGLVGGNVTLITVVVSINQLLLSQELQTPGELQSQISNVIDYRRDVESAAGKVAPVDPLGFLRLLVESTRQEAQRLGGLTVDGAGETGDGEIDDIVETVTDRMDRVDELLDSAEAGTIDVLSAMLNTNYARQINHLRRVKADSGEGLPEHVEGAIDDLIDRLQYIDVARQYFKAIYFQQELSSLSRLLLYAGLPAEGIAIAALLLLTVPTDFPGSVSHLRLLIPVTITVGLAPLAVLSSVIVRTATVTRRTAATVPFTAPEQEK